MRRRRRHRHSHPVRWCPPAVHGRSFDASSHWERKLSTVQRPYLRAIETLARVRKLMGVPMVQINIAAEGGQQVVSNA